MSFLWKISGKEKRIEDGVCEKSNESDTELQTRVAIFLLTSLSRLLRFIQCSRWKQSRQCLDQGCLSRIDVTKNAHIDIDHLLWFGRLFVFLWRSRCWCCCGSRASIVRSHCGKLVCFESIVFCGIDRGYSKLNSTLKDPTTDCQSIREANITWNKDCETWHIHR